MKFIDLNAQHGSIRKCVNPRINTVLEHGQYISGPEVAELEGQLADYVGVKHCIGVSSGTDALHIAIIALGVGQGDEVITTPFTFFATGEMIALLGAKPVFFAIDPRSTARHKPSDAPMTQRTGAGPRCGSRPERRRVSYD